MLVHYAQDAPSKCVVLVQESWAAPLQCSSSGMAGGTDDQRSASLHADLTCRKHNPITRPTKHTVYIVHRTARGKENTGLMTSRFVTGLCSSGSSQTYIRRMTVPFAAHDE